MIPIINKFRNYILKIINVYILSRFKKNGKTYNVSEDERKTIPKVNRFAKYIVYLFWLAILLLILSGFFAFRNSNMAVKTSNINAEAFQTFKNKYIENASEVQYSPKLKLYTDNFVDEYINLPKDNEERDKRSIGLSKYFLEGYEESSNDNKSERKLKSKEFYNIKKSDGQIIVQYIVNYDVDTVVKKEVKEKVKSSKKKDEFKTVVKEENKTVNQNMMLNIPIISDKDVYSVNEMPYFTLIPEDKLLKGKMVQNKIDEKYRFRDEKVNEFIKDFFDKYADSTAEDMTYLMDNPQGLEGTRTVKEISNMNLYKKDKKIIAKVIVSMTDKDSSLVNTEHYTLEIIKKDNKFYVEKFKHTIGGK
ncbi:conjugal transfer protein [Macrococcus armenti]|uniref:conjugal transfer protein n=1 Tax=Macrococcus armenti TaxID=2875764 RepID=UPI001CCDF46D|nr:conjugal transfer protein [Macrococcus armenti]UBH13592.1 conjugal transfer protein [Macrococcus armenti]